MHLSRVASFLFKGKKKPVSFQSTSLNAGVQLNWLQEICAGDIIPSLAIRKVRETGQKSLPLGQKVKPACNFLTWLMM